MTKKRKCPQCAERILAQAHKCKHCGSAVPPLPGPSILVQIVRPIALVFGALFVMFKLVQCSESSPEPVIVDWSKTMASEDRIRKLEQEKDCPGLQDQFDIAEARSGGARRNGIDSSDSEVMAHVDQAMRRAGCYER